ncbi:MAG: hypothetical protein SO267_15035 [Lachnospiraceae bacterium]|nr:hypothetical protein [Lachnospiraceae bacterium]
MSEINIRTNFKKRDSNTVQIEGFSDGNIDGISIQATKDGKFSASGKFDGTWNSTVGLATKDDLPNIYGVQFEKNNEHADHVQTIKNIWNKFPNEQPFVCTVVDSNKFLAVGYIYENRKYGAVLYLAFNSCGIVKCSNTTFSDTKL